MTFGSIYGDPIEPSFITDTGVAVWMWRKGQKVRYFTAEGVSVGPEHRNVYPAMLAAFAAGWYDPSISPMANLICWHEVSLGEGEN